MTVEAIGPGKLDIGRVIGETFAATLRNIVPFGIITLLFGVLPSVLIGLLAVSLGETSGDTTSRSGSIVVSVLAILLQSAVLVGVIGEQQGKRPSAQRDLAAGARMFSPMLGLNAIITIGVVLASLLLLVPGLILATIWSVAGPARVAEGPGVSRALQRSRDLTRGNRWRVFAVFLVIWIGVFVVAFAAGAVLGLLGLFGETLTVADVLAEAAITGPVALIPAVCSGVVYLELRRVKEGADVGGLAEIFS